MELRDALARLRQWEFTSPRAVSVQVALTILEAYKKERKQRRLLEKEVQKLNAHIDDIEDYVSKLGEEEGILP